MIEHMLEGSVGIHLDVEAVEAELLTLGCLFPLS